MAPPANANPSIRPIVPAIWSASPSTRRAAAGEVQGMLGLYQEVYPNPPAESRAAQKRRNDKRVYTVT